MSKLTITHIVENLNRGGLERVVLDLIEEQVRAGHQCEVICLFERGQLADELDDFGVAVRVCDKRPRPDLRALWRVRKFVRAQRPDVLHTHNAVAHYHAVLALMGLRPRPTLVNTRHGMRAFLTPGRREWLYRRTMRFTDAAVTVCEAARAEFARRHLVPRQQLLAIPNGIPVQRFRVADAAAHADLTKQLGLPAATRLIGAVGRLNWAKDPLTLVRAYAQVREKHADTALLLVGKGGLRADVQAAVESLRVADSVSLLGDRSDVPKLLAGLDMFAMSSITEGYSIALLEACAAGLPIVATDVGGNAEIVRDGVNGHVVASRDPQALAAALMALLGDPDKAQAMGRAGRDWVLEYGSLQTMVARYQDLYEVCS